MNVRKAVVVVAMAGTLGTFTMEELWELEGVLRNALAKGAAS